MCIWSIALTYKIVVCWSSIFFFLFKNYFQLSTSPQSITNQQLFLTILVSYGELILLKYQMYHGCIGDLNSPTVGHFHKDLKYAATGETGTPISKGQGWLKPRPQNRFMVPLTDSFTIFDKHPSLLCWYESPPQDAAAKAPPVRKQFLVFTGHVINTKNCNHSINWVKNLGYNRWSKYNKTTQRFRSLLFL